MLLVLTWLACSSEPTPGPAPEAEPPAQPLPEEAPPPGRIGGEPILPDPIVLGAIDPRVVDAAIARQRGAINRCYEDALPQAPGLAGQVLVKFTIAQDGSVSSASTKSTSLRNPAVEACLEAQIARARFPPLESGRLALVSYPFGFPPTTPRSPGR